MGGPTERRWRGHHDLRLLTPARATDLVGSCAPCVFWQTVPHNGHRATPDPSALLRDWVETVTAEWGPPGRVAYVDEAPVGYLLLAPARHVPRLAAFPTAPSDPSTLMLVTACAADDRAPSLDRGGAGLRKMLIRAAAKDALRRGSRSIEVIGARATAIDRHSCVLPVAELEKLGFRVERDHPVYPRLRLDLHTLVTVRDEVAAQLVRAIGRIPGLRPVPETHPDGATRVRSTGAPRP